MTILVNYWAVLLAAIVHFVVGFLWYGPIFGNVWKRLMNFNDENMKNMKLTPMQAMSMGFVAALLMAYVLAYFVQISGSMTVAHAFQLGFWVWLGFLATTSASAFLWEGKPLKLFALNAAAQLVSICAMSLVLVLWQ